jgi:hypothetical protein
MRGLLTLLTSENNLRRYRSGIFLASAAPELVKRVLPLIQQEMPDATFAYLAPMAYAPLFSSGAETVWLDDVKAEPVRTLLGLRRRKFDVVVLLLTGNPTFRKPKLASLVLNPNRFVIFNENADVLIADRRRWNGLRRLVVRRTKMYYLGSLLFFPFGLLYLLGRTLWLVSRARRRRPLTRFGVPPSDATNNRVSMR